jgi:hypothetical protein
MKRMSYNAKLKIIFIKYAALHKNFSYDFYLNIFRDFFMNKGKKNLFYFNNFKYLLLLRIPFYKLAFLK